MQDNCTTNYYRHILKNTNLYMKYMNLIQHSHYSPSLIYHNANHAHRVLIHSVVLSSIMNLTNADKEILYTAAVYHDIGRINDSIDPTHGFRSWFKFIHGIYDNKMDKEQINIVKYLIINHCLDGDFTHNFDLKTREKEYLLRIFKDADALDRVRNNKLNISYLNYDESKKMILFAKELCGFENDIFKFVYSNITKLQ